MLNFVKQLQDFASRLVIETNRDALDRASRELAQVFEWGEALTDIRNVTLRDDISLVRGTLGPQPAAVFAAALQNERSSWSALNDVALYAYHASIEWGLFATYSGMVVFNSHWIRHNDWFRLPLVKWDNVGDYLELWEAVRPVGIASNVIDRVATSIYEPDSFLLPVDDALVNRLDYWRSEALRYARTEINFDESLQTLFAQLFILRVVEDRKLLPELPSLRTAYEVVSGIDLNKLSALLEQAQSAIGSELFEHSAIRQMPERVLSGIINDLYTPYNLPFGAQYNFSWIDADVLGLAYEKYLSTVLSPLPPSPQLSFFEQPIREVDRVSIRKARGVYYTPNYLVHYLTETAINNFEPPITVDSIPRIADFSCGSGSFLVAATESLIKRLRELDPTRNWARELINGRNIIGVDVDERAVTMARLALWLRLAEEPDPLPLPRLEGVIIQGDSLGSEVWERIPDDYDIVVGNPPFIATSRTIDRHTLSISFRSATGRYDYSYLFVEQGVRRLKPNGILALVIPNRLFKNRDAGIVREILAAETHLLQVVDFGSNEVFSGTSAYIGSIVCRKLAKDEIISRDSVVRVIDVVNLSPGYMAVSLLTASTLDKEFRSEGLVAYDAHLPHGSLPWVLVSPSAQAARMQLEDVSQMLSEVALTPQGIKTGANDIYILELESASDGLLVRVVNGLGESYLLERSLLRPVVFGSSIQKYEVAQGDRLILYPYEEGEVIPESSLRERFPKSYEYLQRYRNILSGRSSISSSAQLWYEIVRKRDKTWLDAPKLLMRDLATELSFSIDQHGSTYLVGGTAVVPAEQSLTWPLFVYLNSELVNQYLAQVAPSFRHGFQKYEPQHLSRIPVPNVVLEDLEVQQSLTRFGEELVLARIRQDEGKISALEEEVSAFLKVILGVSKKELM